VAAPKKVDYGLIEADWRAGVKTPSQMAAEYTKATGVSVSPPAIIKHFKKLGVPRDLKDKVQQKADAMVLQAMVTGKVSEETLRPDVEIIDTNAKVLATVQLSHRRDIGRGRNLVMRLLDELEHQTANPDLYEGLLTALEAETDDPKRRRKLQETFHRAMSLGGRASTMKQLADSLRILIAAEREAYGLDRPEKPKAPLEELTADQLKSEIRRLSAKTGLLLPHEPGPAVAA